MDKREEELQLVEDICNGKREHYRILVDRYAPMVFNVVNRFVDNENDAEELAQEIFVKTYERLSSFKGNSKFSSWLYMIAMNHCRDYSKNVRRQNTRFSEMNDHDLQRHLEYSDMPDQDIERSEWLDLLREALDNITQDYAEAFIMKYNNGMSYKSMAKRLDVSVSALKVRVYRAKKELKTYIENRS